MKRHLIIGLFGLAMFYAGVSVGTPIGAKMASAVHPDIQRTWDEIQTTHPDGPFDPEVLKRSAIIGMVRSLGDRHTRYLPPDQAVSWREKYSGDCSIPSVEREMILVGGQNYAHIKISAFYDSTPEHFGSAAGWAIGEGAQGVVLDLRNNRGGRVAAAAEVGCHWLATTTFAIKIRRSGQHEEVNAKCEPLLTGIPTIVLVNGATASAAEMLAGALQDHRAAHLIGEPTFGKGIGQDIIRYDDGSELHLTGFRWTTPLGRSIDRVGIAPDELVAFSPSTASTGDAQLEQALSRLATSN